MNTFLQSTKSIFTNRSNFDHIYVVLGNESCDLDSVISSLVYAYFLHHKLVSVPVVPVLNIQQNEFIFRTETQYLLKKNNILSNNLTFRNDINLKTLQDENKLKLTLVDHQVLTQNDQHLSRNIIEIIDHRPSDPDTKFDHANININLVGSCATLITEVIFDQIPAILDETITKLLHGTIILDTINFDPNAKRFSELDEKMITKLEKLHPIEYTRAKIFNDLTSARSDISNFTPFEILQRDMKIVNGTPFPGFPMLITDFIQMPNAAESMKQLCEKYVCHVIVLISLVTEDNRVRREIGIYSTKDCGFKTALMECLEEQSKELELKRIENNVEGLVLYLQGNIKMSRKHIIPLLRGVINEYKNNLN